MTLLTLEDIQEHKPMSKNIDWDKKVEPFIKEAQYFDLKDIVGDALYLALVQEVDTDNFVKYGDLWKGSTYKCGGDDTINPGLKKVLVYYSYARFLTNAPTNSVAYDMVRKENKYSEGTSRKDLADSVAQAQSGGRGLEFDVIKFLNTNSSDYPLYKCPETQGTAGRIRISTVG